MSIEVVMGKRGEGKSTYLKNMVRASIYPVFIIDTMNEYDKEAKRIFSLDDDMFFKTRYVPKPPIDQDFDRAMTLLSVHRPNTINLVVDEVDMFSGTHYISDPLIELLKFSRHYNINFYCSCRNPVELNRRISGLADRFVIFKITEPRYLKYFSELEPGLDKRIRALEKHEKIILDFH